MSLNLIVIVFAFGAKIQLICTLNGEDVPIKYNRGFWKGDDVTSGRHFDFKVIVLSSMDSWEKAILIWHKSC